MTKQDAVKLIDDNKNQLLNPVEMLHWTWLRVIINSMDEEEWEELLSRASVVLSK